MKHETNFQKKVYSIVKKVQKGKVLSYKKVAELAGHPRAWRAVGNILNQNRNSKIPCHRVIKSNGEIGDYKGGTKKKIYLLKSEHIKLCARPSTEAHNALCARCSRKKT